MALEAVAAVPGAVLSLDVDGTGVVTAVQVDVTGPGSAVVQVRNPAGQVVRASITLPPSGTPYRYAVPGNRRAPFDDGNPTSSTGWTYELGTA